MPVSPSTQHLLDGALGWLELGNNVEARNELEKLPRDQRATPKCSSSAAVSTGRRRSGTISTLAESCYSAHPQEPQFLIDWAWAEYKLDRREHAAVMLLRESKRFPDSEPLAYDLAVVLASLDRMAEARDWLAKAFERASEPEKLKLRGLEQPELEKVWTQGQSRK